MPDMIVGIDLSLTCTGIGILTETSTGVKCSTGTVKSTGKRSATLPERHLRITELGADIVHHAGHPDVVLAVIEGPLTGMRGGSPIDTHALHWFVMGALVRRGVPIAIVSPPAMKKAITGNGGSDKAAVAVAVARIWPDAEVTSSDVSDAVGLAHLGAVALGWDVVTLARHDEVKWTEWPRELERVE